MSVNRLLKYKSVPDYKNITSAEWNSVISGIIRKIDGFSKKLTNLKSGDWNDFWVPYIKIFSRGDEILDQLHLMSITNGNVSWQARSKRFEHKYSLATEKLYSNDNFTDNLLKLAKKPLSSARQQAIASEIKFQELNGLLLAEPERKLFVQYNNELFDLIQQFYLNYTNALRDEKLYLRVRTESQLGEMPAALKSNYFDGKSSWLFDFSDNSYVEFMTYCPVRALRKDMYYRYHTLCSEFGPAKYNNNKIIRKILRLRNKKAQLLGYNNYADLTFAYKKSKTPAKIKKFLLTTLDKLRLDFEKDLDVIRAVGMHEFNLKKIQPWDLYFIDHAITNYAYDNHNDDVVNYLELNNVLKGLFSLCEELYKIRFKKLNVSSWHKDIKYYKIFDQKSNRALGVISLDLLARPNKEPSCYCKSTIRGLSAEDRHQLAVVNVVTSFVTPQNGNPILLTINDLGFLFHEMGHAIDGVCRRYKNYNFTHNELSTPDEHELPSQFLEKFAYEWSVVKNIASHHVYGKKLPRKLFDMTAHKSFSFQRKLDLLEGIKKALFDLEIHESNKNLIDVHLAVNARCDVVPSPRWQRFCSRFYHGFGLDDVYACNFFGYIWTEMYAADLCAKFISKGNNIPDGLSYKFRKEFLEGRATGINKSFRKFMGRSLRDKPFLRFYGIN